MREREKGYIGTETKVNTLPTFTMYSVYMSIMSCQNICHYAM